MFRFGFQPPAIPPAPGGVRLIEDAAEAPVKFFMGCTHQSAQAPDRKWPILALLGSAAVAAGAYGLWEVAADPLKPTLIRITQILLSTAAACFGALTIADAIRAFQYRPPNDIDVLGVSPVEVLRYTAAEKKVTRVPRARRSFSIAVQNDGSWSFLHKAGRSEPVPFFTGLSQADALSALEALKKPAPAKIDPIAAEFIRNFEANPAPSKPDSDPIAALHAALQELGPVEGTKEEDVKAKFIALLQSPKLNPVAKS